MTKTIKERSAYDVAKQNGTSYGMSVFDGRWYTGSVEQLRAIGCVSIKTPKTDEPPYGWDKV